jgi:hypothetical protein
VLVRGADEHLRGLLLQALDDVNLPVEDAGGHGELDGNNRCNIVNRTLRGKGAQLEISEPLRDTMFGDNSRPHHHPGVLDLRGRLPRRPGPARSRAGHRQPGPSGQLRPRRSMPR